MCFPPRIYTLFIFYIGRTGSMFQLAVYVHNDPTATALSLRNVVNLSTRFTQAYGMSHFHKSNHLNSLLTNLRLKVHQFWVGPDCKWSGAFFEAAWAPGQPDEALSVVTYCG